MSSKYLSNYTIIVNRLAYLLDSRLYRMIFVKFYLFFISSCTTTGTGLSGFTPKPYWEIDIVKAQVSMHSFWMIDPSTFTPMQYTDIILPLREQNVCEC